MNKTRNEVSIVRAHLGMWDAVSIIIGIVIGSTIFRSAPLIMSNVSGPWAGLAVWALGGVLSFIGALCIAELASTYPRTGGDYVYLTRAFGPWAGFLFGWANLSIILPSSIGAMAFVFSDYAVELFGIEGDRWGAPVAIAAVTGLTAINALGVVLGKSIQNLLSTAKMLGLVGIVIAGFGWGHSGGMATATPVKDPNFGLAMILVLYAYGGWNDAAFVAAEVRERRHIVGALLVGTTIITVVYLAVNAAYLRALGFDGLRDARAVAADVLKLPLRDTGARAMSIVVMVAALSAINGLIFTGSRVYAALGAEHSVFAWLGRWDPQFGSPTRSLAVQWAVSIAMIVGVGTEFGRNSIDLCLTSVQLRPLPWKDYFGGFNTLVAATAPVFWTFFLLTGISLFVLRIRDRHLERPFTVPGFPVVPLIFCGMCEYMRYSAVAYAKTLALFGAAPMAIGLVLYACSEHKPTADGTGD